MEIVSAHLPHLHTVGGGQHQIGGPHYAAAVDHRIRSEDGSVVVLFVDGRHEGPRAPIARSAADDALLLAPNGGGYK